jgi:hypothetical protein
MIVEIFLRHPVLAIVYQPVNLIKNRLVYRLLCASGKEKRCDKKCDK